MKIEMECRQPANPPICVWVRGRVVMEVGGPNNTSILRLGAREVPVVMVASRIRNAISIVT